MHVFIVTRDTSIVLFINLLRNAKRERCLFENLVPKLSLEFVILYEM